MLRAFAILSVFCATLAAGCAFVGGSAYQRKIEITGTVIDIVAREEKHERGTIPAGSQESFSQVLIVRPISVSGRIPRVIMHDGMLWVAVCWMPDWCYPEVDDLLGRRIRLTFDHMRRGTHQMLRATGFDLNVDHILQFNSDGSVTIRDHRGSEKGEPGATDNPDDAQRLREDL